MNAEHAYAVDQVALAASKNSDEAYLVGLYRVNSGVGSLDAEGSECGPRAQTCS